KRNAIDPFHDEERNIVMNADVIEVNDVRVLEGRRERRLLHEHRAHPRVARELRRHGLHRKERIRIVVWMGEPDRAHAPFSEHLHELVSTDPLAVRDTAHLPNMVTCPASLNKPFRRYWKVGALFLTVG